MSDRRDSAELPYENAPRRTDFQRFFVGGGVEIGALHRPMPVDRTVGRVRYLDRLTIEVLRAHYPEYGHRAMVRPDVLADTQLVPIRENTQNFVIANHLLEHLEDPIGALKEWYRILKPGGILFLAIPDKRRTFDRDRPRTSLVHLVEDHADGGKASQLAHYEEWARLVCNKTDPEAAGEARRLIDTRYNIHFHVWIPEDVRDLIEYLGRRSLRWQVVQYVGPGDDSDEFIYVLRKSHTLASLTRHYSVHGVSLLRRVPGRAKRSIQRRWKAVRAVVAR
jgi:SAM-dependent methyltransferase